MKILVSACLLGLPCRYDGKSKPCQAVLNLSKEHELIPICPEELGGLTTPRPPSELQKNGHVLNQLGQNVTQEYRKGALEALHIAQANGCHVALLKEKSPSCGNRQIYDGSFSKTLTDGDGITASLLRQNGITVFGESDITDLQKFLCI